MITWDNQGLLRNVQVCIGFVCRKSWAKAGFSGIAFDILLDKGHDLTSFAGCTALLGMLLQRLGI